MWTSRDDYNLLVLNGAMPMDAGMWTCAAADVRELAQFASRGVWAHDGEAGLPAAVVDGGRARWPAAQIEARMAWLRASFRTDAERDEYVRVLADRHATETVCDAGGVGCCHGDARSAGESQPACATSSRFVDRQYWSARAYRASLHPHDGDGVARPVGTPSPPAPTAAGSGCVVREGGTGGEEEGACDECAARAHAQMCRRCVARLHAVLAAACAPSRHDGRAWS